MVTTSLFLAASLASARLCNQESSARPLPAPPRPPDAQHRLLGGLAPAGHQIQERFTGRPGIRAPHEAERPGFRQPRVRHVRGVRLRPGACGDQPVNRAISVGVVASTPRPRRGSPVGHIVARQSRLGVRRDPASVPRPARRRRANRTASSSRPLRRRSRTVETPRRPTRRSCPWKLKITSLPPAARRRSTASGGTALPAAAGPRASGSRVGGAGARGRAVSVSPRGEVRARPGRRSSRRASRSTPPSPRPTRRRRAKARRVSRPGPP